MRYKRNKILPQVRANRIRGGINESRLAEMSNIDSLWVRSPVRYPSGKWNFRAQRAQRWTPNPSVPFYWTDNQIMNAVAEHKEDALCLTKIDRLLSGFDERSVCSKSCADVVRILKTLSQATTEQKHLPSIVRIKSLCEERLQKVWEGLKSEEFIDVITQDFVSSATKAFLLKELRRRKELNCLPKYLRSQNFVENILM
eukprot:PhF_6_TR6827/c0_g1_i3/m.9829